jgi:hydrogenase maturation protease
MRKSTLILGMGNTLAGDDGVGIQVVREFAARLTPAEAADLDVEETAESYMAILDHVGNYGRIVIVDALRGEPHEVGSVRRIGLDDAMLHRRLPFSHLAGLASVLSLARECCGAMFPDVAVIGITVGEISEFKEGLSPQVGPAVVKGIAFLRQMLWPAVGETPAGDWRVRVSA